MDKKKDKKKKFKKKGFFIVLLILFLSGVLYFTNFETSNMGDYFFGELEPVSAQAEVTDLPTNSLLTVNDKMLTFSKGNHQVNLSIHILVNGTYQNINNQFDWWKMVSGDRWKFGANITIPDTQAGEFIAENLQEVVFVINSTVPLGVLKKGLVDGFTYQDGVVGTSNGLTTTRYINFNFRDIIDSYPNQNLTFTKSIHQQGDIHILVLRVNVSQVNFQAGMVVELDPTIVIDNVQTYASVDKNVSKSAYPASWISTNDTALVGYWNFDLNPDRGVRVESNTTQMGTGINGDGDGVEKYVNVPFDQSLNFSNINFTVSFWWTMDGYNDDCPMVGMGRSFIAGGGVDMGWGVGYENKTGGRRRMRTEFGNGTNGAWIFDNFNVELGKWYFHTMVLDANANEFRVYRDGVYKDNSNIAGVVFDGDDLEILSNLANPGGGYHNGSIDNVMIFNRSLSATEITHLYTNQTSGINSHFEDDAALRGMWKFDEPHGSRVAVDSSPEGNTGTLTNFGTPIEYDLTGYGNNGTYTTRAGQNDTGWIGGGAHCDFSSGSNINLGTPDSLYLDVNNFTISTWFYAPSGSRRSFAFASRGNANQDDENNQWQFLHLGSSNSTQFRMGNNTAKVSVQSATNTVRTGPWHHVVVSVNGTNYMNLYSDGNFLTASENTLGGTAKNNQTYIGTKAGNNLCFNGTIDEVMIFNRTLNATEVLAIFNNQSYRFITPATQEFTIGSWFENTTLTTGLGDTGTFSDPTAWEMDSGNYLITGDDNGQFTGFTWNETSWVSNTTLISGLGDIGSWSSPTVFDIGSTFHLIAGDLTGGFTGFTWNETGWDSNSTMVNGLADTGAASKPSAFELNGEHLISGWSDGTYTGFSWNGTGWGSNATMVSGLGDVGDSSTSDYFPINSGHNLILGNQVDTLEAFSWNSSGWIANTTIDGGLLTDADYATPTYVKLDTDVNLIKGRLLGSYFGYTWFSGGQNRVNVTYNTTLNFNSGIQLRIKEYENGAWLENTTWQTLSDGDNNLNMFNISTDANSFILEFNFTTDANNFYTPILHDSIYVNIWSNGTVPGEPADSCTYSSGTWEVDCSDDCDITTNVSIDAGHNISMTSAGTFTINDGVMVSGYDYRYTEAQCYYIGKGSGGFY